ncbi:hypothetical protein [Rhodococcus rhodochrous]|uniref:hypothetical protein n=1 Tax=Rhodococcus rhodochrous TaxID=1829 RepID=UPI0017837E14|nr:hypothetical protein [Rhodococcus rhodochrous]QOH56224.1 hypothetical protein C6Y44_09810 [Rhodococcus rhodochrous]
MTSKTEETNTVELGSRQCAEVAKYMYEQWQEAMKPPLYIYQDFPTWLDNLIDAGAQEDAS